MVSIITLDRNQRWLQSKKFLLEKCAISVHLSAIHSNYYSAWQYVTKQDSRFIESVGHPDLANYHQPRTTLGSLAKHSRRRKTPSFAAQTEYTSDKKFENTDDEISETNAKGVKRKKKRISSYEMSEIIVAKNIKTRNELLALAREQTLEGKTNIGKFIMKRF